MAKKVIELVDDLISSLQAKIETETNEQAELQSIIDSAQTKLGLSLIESNTASDMIADINAVKNKG